MRIAVVAAAVCLSIVGLALANNANASIRKPTHIAAQGLGPALKQLAQSRGLQVLYLSNTVRDVRTHGANGDITANEAFDQLLTGTGLTYRYLDDNTVTVIPVTAPPSRKAPGSRCKRSGGASSAPRTEEAKRSAANRFRWRRRPRPGSATAAAAAGRNRAFAGNHRHGIAHRFAERSEHEPDSGHLLEVHSRCPARPTSPT